MFIEDRAANRCDLAEVIFVKRLLQNALPEEIRTQIAKRLFQKYVGCEESGFAKKLYMNFSQMKEMKKMACSLEFMVMTITGLPNFRKSRCKKI